MVEALAQPALADRWIWSTAMGTATFTFADSNSATSAYSANGIAQRKLIAREVFQSAWYCLSVNARVQSKHALRATVVERPLSQDSMAVSEQIGRQAWVNPRRSAISLLAAEAV